MQTRTKIYNTGAIRGGAGMTRVLALCACILMILSPSLMAEEGAVAEPAATATAESAPAEQLAVIKSETVIAEQVNLELKNQLAGNETEIAKLQAEVKKIEDQIAALAPQPQSKPE